ncbi:sulfurtransferase [uncultured Erythrobacter sp.]|uniref:sulfurtransferase n=1 Tax=uncultured Erythrobacter sp. TaxID=263913 RepID=UPI00262A6204|nr:sulfurtransferase [uncultured Erythrobacter sp.]
MQMQMDSLVSTHWLADRLGATDLLVLDASRHLPAAGRDAHVEFEIGHITGARFLDLATLTDTASPVPAALPRPDQVADRLAQLGAEPGARIVLYDDSALRSSARAWFTLTQSGLTDVAILDGGLNKWRVERRQLDCGISDQITAEASTLKDTTKVVTKAEMLANCQSGEFQVLDARAADRVFSSGIDPVHGGQNGRIPGALNLPFGKVLNADGTFKSPEDIRAAFKAARVDLARPLVTTCGSGITASVLLFAAHLIGKHDVRLYDGSWQEWEADPDTPKEQGPE